MDKNRSTHSHPSQYADAVSGLSAAPVIVGLLMVPNRFTALLAGLIFSAAAITDYFDGYLARRYGLVSNLGKVMDPVADKLLVSLRLIMLSAAGLDAGLDCVHHYRTRTGRYRFAQHHRKNRQDVSASNLGKYKTGFQIAAIIPLMFHYPLWASIFTPSACSFFGAHCC
jgi:CDP-diacylglycerol--glycerol-3-phosphate 3-phosphatidyltransferase